ncbi:MAG TPA: DUF3102 domain-containing protein [Stellaceae bacterium]|nr:DUF3102 domain-containing protein [Stellaceae bacterium]
MSASDRNNRLVVLAAEIVAAHQDTIAATGQAIARAVDAGRCLIEAKRALPHGGWLPWLRREIGFSARAAQGYMRLAEMSAEDAQRVAHLSVRRALHEIGEHRASAKKREIGDDDARWQRRREFADLWLGASPAARLRMLQYLQARGEFRQTTEAELHLIVAQGCLRDMDDPGRWYR